MNKLLTAHSFRFVRVVRGGLFDLSLSEKCHGKRAHVLLSSIDPCPSLARPLAYERLGAIVEWFEKLGAAVLFSIIVQTSALDEARYQVVDGSHRSDNALFLVDRPLIVPLGSRLRASSWTRAGSPSCRPRSPQNSGPSFAKGWRSSTSYTPRSGRSLARCLRPHNNAPLPPAQHLKEDYIDVAVYNTLDPEAMLELQHRVNLLTHDARFGSSTFDVLLNLKRASLQVCRLPSIDYHHPTSPPLSGPQALHP